MLYILSNVVGDLVFEVAPFNTHQVERTSQTDFAEKPILGAPPRLELVGEGGESVTMSCRIFPEAVGGLDEMDLLRRMRQSGGPAALMRGDGEAMGWFVVTNVRELHTYLQANGVGRMVDVEISLQRAYKPTAAEYQQPAIAGMWDYNASQVLKNTWGQEPS